MQRGTVRNPSDTNLRRSAPQRRLTSAGEADRFMGDIAPVRRRTTLIMALTLLVVVGLVAVHRAVVNLQEPMENVMPPPAPTVDMLDSASGNLYVKAVAKGEFAEVFSRTAWMQARVDYLRDSLGEPECDRAADEFFRSEHEQFLALDDAIRVLGSDGIEDRILFGRALGCELVSQQTEVTLPAIRPGEPLSEFRYRLTYPNAAVTPSLPSGDRVKALEASLFVTERGKVVKANVVGNAVIHMDSVELYLKEQPQKAGGF